VTVISGPPGRPSILSSVVVLDMRNLPSTLKIPIVLLDLVTILQE
jgi:hypothetical protein